MPSIRDHMRIWKARLMFDAALLSLSDYDQRSFWKSGKLYVINRRSRVLRRKQIERTLSQLRFPLEVEFVEAIDKDDIQTEIDHAGSKAQGFKSFLSKHECALSPQINKLKNM